MATAQASSYDEIPYGDNCFPYTHPDYLATMGMLYGIQAPPADRCRVLELGCAGGGNLIPMALELPEARFVGIDLSSRQIAVGKALLEELGLSNIDLRAMSITEVNGEFGLFDYIVCHGVYSWVPEDVRDKILAICSEQLAPDGIAYVSYNTYPGWHARGMVRELLAFHVRRSASAVDRVQEARDFLEEMVRVLPNQASAYARILRTEEEFLRGVANSYLYHEHLEETNHPCYFHEFVDRAMSKGLQYLAEVRTPGLIDSLPHESRDALWRWAEDEVASEQYLDFLCNRTFRRTLLCHRHQGRRRTPSPEGLSSLSISTNVVPSSPEPDIASDAPEEFRRPDGAGTLTTTNPIVKAALVVLDEVRPQALPFDTLWDRIRSRLNREDRTVADRDDDGPSALKGSMLRCFLSNLVELHTHPPRFSIDFGERPTASPLARLQARESDRVTNLRRRTVELGEFDRLVLSHLDGSRECSSILDTLVALVVADEFTIVQGDEPIRDPRRIREMLGAELEPSLQRLARLALLIR